VQASKAHAALVGRAFVTPEDLQAMAPYVLGHRLVLTGDAPPHTAESIVAEATRRVSYRSHGSPR
jgi:MoxR-like ATPase